MNKSLALDFGTRDRVLFRSLIELLRLDETNHSQSKTDLQFDSKAHFFATQIDDQAELSRQILLNGFRPDSSVLRSQINACDPSTLALYRGFSRFMLEDLEHNRYALGMSRSQRRKLSLKIAIEMIEVRDAVSTDIIYHCKLIMNSAIKHTPT
jgi:pyoverdine/dityrosine biosynthesis protein Dit1